MKTTLPKTAITATILSLAINFGLMGAIVVPHHKPAKNLTPTTNPTNQRVTIKHQPTKSIKNEITVDLAKTDNNGRKIITLPAINVYPTYSERVELARVKQREQRNNGWQIN